jgi:hypothetical protein
MAIAIRRQGTKGTTAMVTKKKRQHWAGGRVSRTRHQDWCAILPRNMPRNFTEEYRSLVDYLRNLHSLFHELATDLLLNGQEGESLGVIVCSNELGKLLVDRQDAYFECVAQSGAEDGKI